MYVLAPCLQRESWSANYSRNVLVMLWAENALLVYCTWITSLLAHSL